jgi:starch synthase
MHILMISAEAAPFAKTGGLADVVWALSKALVSRGHTVGCLIPRYSWIDIPEATVIGGNTLECFDPQRYRIHRSMYDGIDLYTVENRRFEDRSSLYGKASGSYADNALRFSIIGHAALTLARTLPAGQSVIHGHDWHSGTGVGLCSRQARPGQPGGIPTVLTIHNAAYEGRFSKHDIQYTGLPGSAFSIDPGSLRDSAEISFLYAGVKLANVVTTVSPGYATELKGDENETDNTDPLRRLFRERNLTGILNGVDYTEWNPETDSALPHRYSAHNIAGKRMCKKSLLAELGLQEWSMGGRVPLIGMIARLTDQKGLEELCFPDGGALARICNLDAQFVILGTGDRRYENELTRIASRFENLAVRIGFDEGLAHRIEAGCDLYLMPSRFEPCGLNQLYSLRYGTPPIVHATGGLADTVVDIHADPDNGTGYLYKHQTPDDIVRAVARGVDRYRLQPEIHHDMMIRGMLADYSWDKTATEYERVYRRFATG